MGLDNPVHIAFLLIILLLVFGAKRLPEMGRSLGGGLREFKDSISGASPNDQPDRQIPPAAPAAAPPAAPAAEATPVATPVPPAPPPDPPTGPTAAPGAGQAEPASRPPGEHEPAQG